MKEKCLLMWNYLVPVLGMIWIVMGMAWFIGWRVIFVGLKISIFIITVSMNMMFSILSITMALASFATGGVDHRRRV
ncbi:hypothetical protein [Paenibacillus larvae]|nr:hypothetical protein [Paenibacillus larvae]MDR5566964.1 hypothetical protein [Paenibacillus larvae]MDR5595041.1 hypothetical protein [Paenibacillus larvae]QHZ53362.1 hypothetical protein ERICV_04311 [Paenibacillus larvae subsp. larvae]